MSGVEVVGIVLGAIPLAISAIEHYRDCLDPFIDYAHYQSTLKALRTRLRIQLSLYEGTLKRLLLSELSQIEAEALFPGTDIPPNKALWGTAEIEYKLKKKLGSGHETFMDVVQEMERLMNKLMDKLNVDMNGKPKWDSPMVADPNQTSRLGWEWRKIRRSFGKREREALIQSFEIYNNNIASFVQNNEILAPTTESQANAFLAYSEVVRNHAMGLYNALETSWKCSSPHRVNLRLDSSKSKAIKRIDHRFIVFFYICSEEQTARKWKEASLSPITADKADSTLKDPTPPTLKLEQSGGKTVKESKILRFLSPKKQPIAGLSNIPSIKTSQTANSVEPPISIERPTISCICQAMNCDSTSSNCLGLLRNLDPDNPQCLSLTKIESSTPTADLSLGEIILAKEERASQVPKVGKLSRKQRLGLAVTLASSVLQFYNSPWLDETWGKSDIKFFSTGIGPDSRPSIGEPYICRTFSSSRSNRLDSPTTSKNQFLSGLVVNKTLFALGVILIELCLNRPFEDLRATLNPTLVGQPTVADDFLVATKSIDEVYMKGGTEYGYVVQRCLRCEFGIQDSKKILDFDGFRSLFCNFVVGPLEEDYKKYSLYRPL